MDEQKADDAVGKNDSVDASTEKKGSVSVMAAAILLAVVVLTVIFVATMTLS